MKKITSLDVAILCHETNRAYCALLGDNSQPPWAQAPAWQSESAMKGVEFHLAKPDATEAASHESWLEQKRADGWTYGPVKDAEKKTHPCFVPFTSLPAEQQVKDALFKSIVSATRRLIDSPEGKAPASLDPIVPIAGELYEAYSAAVGGKAFNGDPLPGWAEFFADPKKSAQAAAWIAVAKKANPPTEAAAS
jgi:hypothetical protein